MSEPSINQQFWEPNPISQQFSGLDPRYMVSSKFQPVPAVRNVKHVEGSEPRRGRFAGVNAVEARGCNGLEKPR